MRGKTHKNDSTAVPQVFPWCEIKKNGWLSSRSFDPDLAFTGPVEFQKVNTLPGSELKYSVFYNQGEAWPRKNSFNVGVGISFIVTEGCFSRDHFGQVLEKISLDVGVRIFVDR